MDASVARFEHRLDDLQGRLAILRDEHIAPHRKLVDCPLLVVFPQGCFIDAHLRLDRLKRCQWSNDPCVTESRRAADSRFSAGTDPQRNTPMHGLGLKGYTLKLVESPVIVSGILVEEQPQDRHALLEADHPFFPGNAEGGIGFGLPAEGNHQGDAPVGDDI